MTTTKRGLKKKAPDHLSAASRSWFADIAGTFDLESHHYKLLVAACEAWDRREEARKKLSKEGLVFRNRHGEIRPHPCVAVEKDSVIRFCRVLRELALDVQPPPAAPRPPRTGGQRW